MAALFAPCQAFDTAFGHAVTEDQAVKMGLLNSSQETTKTCLPVERLRQKVTVARRRNPLLIVADEAWPLQRKREAEAVQAL